MFLYSVSLDVSSVCFDVFNACRMRRQFAENEKLIPMKELNAVRLTPWSICYKPCAEAIGRNMQ